MSYDEEAFDEAVKAGGSGDKFINLEDGDPHILGTIVGRKWTQQLFWNEGLRVYEDFDKTIHQGKPAFQLSLNFHDHEKGTMHILQGKTALVIAYSEQCEEYGVDIPGEFKKDGKTPVKSIDHLVYKIQRKGLKAKTRFTFLVQPGMEPPKTFPPLHDLEEASRRGGSGAAEAAVAAGAPPADDLPF